MIGYSAGFNSHDRQPTTCGIMGCGCRQPTLTIYERLVWDRFVERESP